MMVEEKIGKYQIIKKIAQGGMGEVYQAQFLGPQGFSKNVVIKKISSGKTSGSEHLIQEAKILSQLQHPNIIHVYELGEVEDGFFLAMEEVDGWDLEELLFRKKRFSLGSALFILYEVLKGVSYAHKKGVIHRDLSLSNILISKEGIVKIADFGIAGFGKASYLAPEVVKGEAPTFLSDLFSVGQVFYELLFGEKFKQSKISFEDKEIKKMLLKALQPNPQKRYASADEWRKEVEQRFSLISIDNFVQEIMESREETRVIETVRDKKCLAVFDIARHFFLMSSLRRQGSSIFRYLKIPAFAGMTLLLLGGLYWYFLPSEKFGFLSMRTHPWSYVFIENAKYMTPFYRLKLKEGTYEVYLSNPEIGKDKKMTVHVKNNQNTIIQEEL